MNKENTQETQKQYQDEKTESILSMDELALCDISESATSMSKTQSFYPPGMAA